MSIIKTVLFSFILLSIFSCLPEIDEKEEKEEKEESYKVLVRIKAVTESSDSILNGLAVQIESLRTKEILDGNLDENGEFEIRLDKGTYNIRINKFDEKEIIAGIKENYSINKDETITIQLSHSTVKKEGLIFKEIFFNGESYGDFVVQPDVYFVLFNNGDHLVYADNVTFCVTFRRNWGGEDVVTDLLPDYIVVAQMYSIPGDGTTYPVYPGKQIVIAATAIDHSKTTVEDDVNGNGEIITLDKGTDLSGADFEVYEPEIKGGDVDNPDVPNLIANYRFYGNFVMPPAGQCAFLIFHPQEDMNDFMDKNIFKYRQKNGKLVVIYKVPQELVLDGIETYWDTKFKVKSLPLSVDMGKIGVSEGGQQELVIRKSYEKNGRTYLVDTNNSTNDCYIQKGQNSYPKGYQNK